jgi:hypothetical protein
MTDYNDAIDQVLGKVETEVPTITPETLPKVTQETDNPYEGIVADYMQSQDSNEKIANNQNSYLASQEDSQKALSINKLARDFGVNYEAAKISENELLQQKKNKAYSDTLQKVKTDSPNLYEKLNTPEKLAIAHDDIDNLSLFDRVTKSFEQSTQTGQDNLRLARIAEKQFLGQELTAIEINDLRNIESRQSKTKDYDINWFLGIPEAVSENIPLMADPFLSKEAFTGAGIGAGIGGVTGSAAAGVGAIPGAIGGATTGFFWGRNTRIARNETALAFSEFSKFTDDDGVVIEPNTARAGAIVSGLISTGLESIGLKSIAKTVPQADEFLQKFTKVGVKKAFKNKVVRGYMKRFGDVVQASATEGGTEFLQEFSQSIIGEISKAISSGNFDAFTSKDSPEAGFWGWLAETSEKSVKAGLRGSQGGAGFASVGTAISVGIEKSQKKIQAKQEQSQLQKAVEKAEKSTIAKDDPDLFLELTDDADSKAYMSPQEVKEFFQDKPEQYALFQEKIPELKDQIDEAIETGGDLVLPANKVALTLADMGIKDMVKIMRLTPEAITDTDAIAQINEIDTIDIYDDETNKSFEFRDTIKDQIMNAGFVPDTAKSYTDALMSFYDTQYIRTAKSPEARQKLNEYYENLIIRNVTDAEQTKNLDELDLLVERAKLYRGRQGKFKQRPLQGFFKQQGGIKSDTSFAGDLRSLGISNKGGVFKAKSDFRYDAIPVSEFEDHFQVKGVPDDGQGYVPTDFLSDIADQELQGIDWRDDYGVNNQPIKEAKNILNLLDKADIDITTAKPEQIRQVLTGAKSELFQETKNEFDTPDGTPYTEKTITIDGEERSAVNSNGQPIAQTKEGLENFWNWFGDSNVVDDKGNPLVVYHGTQSVNFNDLDEVDDFEFEINASMGRDRTNSTAFYFSPDKSIAEYYSDEYSGSIGEFYLKSEYVLDLTTANGADVIVKALENGEIEDGTFSLSLAGKTVSQEKIINNFWDYLGELQDEYNIPDLNDFANEITDFVNNSYDGLKFVDSTRDEEGISYVAFNPEQIKSTSNQGTFDPQDPRILYQDKESIKRGSFIKTPRGNVSIINVFKDRDLSTILHETGHFYLEVMRDLATSLDAPAEIKADWQDLKNWLELEGNDINTEAHENFARGFEAYLMEGNAPSQLLLDVFRKFKSWLTSIYKTIANLDVTLNDDVRAIFDRMLATEFETENLKNKNLFRPDPEILKMLTKAEQDAYIARNEKAIAETQEKALSKGIKEQRKQQKDVIDKERAGIEKDARERIYNEPIHKLRYFLDKGKMPLEGQDALIEDARLNRDLLAQEYGEEYAKLIPGKYLSKDGEAPSMVADLFGFADDGQMLNALINAPKAEQEIKRSVNEDIKNRYGDPLTDGTIERDALDAAYEDARENNINYEYQVIKRKTDTITAGKKQLESRAKEIVSETKVGDIIAPHKYYRAEVRAAAEAQKHLAKKNYEQAAKAKQRQLLNYYLYRESRNARQFTEKTLKRFKKYQKRPAAGKVKIDEDYRQKAVQLINAFDFASRSNKKDAVKTLDQWQKQKEQDDGVTFLEVEPQILEYNDKQHFRDMSYQDFYSLAENIENIIAQGRLNRSIEIDGKRQEITDIAQELTTQVQENFKGVNIPFEPRTRGEQLKRTFKEFFYSTIKARTFFRELDGFKEFGNFYKYILNPINQASNKMLARQQDVAKQLNDIFDTHYEGRLAGDLNKKTYIASLGQSVSKQAMLSYALNYGAVENRDRLITDNNLTETQLNEILSQLTKKDFTFVQDVWNFLEGFKTDIWALEKRRNGIEPQEVQKVGFQVTTKDGSTMQLDGGYYPIKYEQEKSVQVTQETLEDLKNVTSKSAQTKRGHTKARAKNVNKPLRNDLGVLFSHVSQVVHDLEMGETLQNSYKILKKNDLSNSIVRAKGRAFYDQLEMWIQDQAIGGSLGAQGMESLLDGLRSGVSISTMGFKASTVLVQLTGVTQTMATIGSKYGLKGLVKTFGNGNPAFIKDAFQVAYEKSAILSERSETFNRDVNDAMRQMQAGGKFKQKLTQLAFYPMIKTQAIVDVMAWHGAYQKGLDTLDGNEAKAIEYADDIIVRSQGSGSLKDLSALERGTISANNRFNKFAKLFTVYYSYFNTKLNIAYEKTKNTDFKNPESVLNLATDYFLLYMLEYALGAIILGQLPSDEKDDDYATWLLKGTIGNISGQVPILREMYSVSQGFDASPAGLRGLGEIPKAGMSLLKAGSAAFDDNEDVNVFKLLRDVNMAGGIVFKYPASQVNQVLRAMEKTSKGEDVAPSEYLLYKK